MAGYGRPGPQGLSCRSPPAVGDVALIMDGYEPLDLDEIDFAPMEHDAERLRLLTLDEAYELIQVLKKQWVELTNNTPQRGQP
ncbi:hypothetical protein ASD48_40305 [Streptomyces sp. Root1310]|nr:hypothetical protein ASD48_40305 [Streptomyces sp. Root1310]